MGTLCTNSFDKIKFKYTDNGKHGTLRSQNKQQISQHKTRLISIKSNGQLPFQDGLVFKNNVKLSFDILYRNVTNIIRYILNNSHRRQQHKMTSFNFLVDRLLC